MDTREPQRGQAPSLWFGVGPELVTAEGFGLIFLRLGEVLSDDLPGLRRDPVGEVDGELHDEVAALGRVLGKRQAFPPEPLHHPRLDDVVAGEGDDAVLQCGDANGAATQSLEKRSEGLTCETEDFSSSRFTSAPSMTFISLLIVT